MIPVELLVEILAYINCKHDFKSLMSASKVLSHEVKRILFKSVEIHSHNQHMMPLLSGNTEYIRSVTIGDTVTNSDDANEFLSKCHNITKCVISTANLLDLRTLHPDVKLKSFKTHGDLNETSKRVLIETVSGPYLEHISLGKYSFPYSEDKQHYHDATMEILERSSNLIQLELCGIEITRELFDRIKSLKHLRDLSLFVVVVSNEITHGELSAVCQKVHIEYAFRSFTT